MADTLADLEARMARAVADEDFELAATLRDLIAKHRAGETAPELPEGTRIRREVPGRMGIGTDVQRMAPPKGWTPPKKPDPMTSGHKPGGRRRK